MPEPEPAVEIAGRVRHQVAEEAEHLRRRLDRPHRRPGDDGADRMDAEEERGDDAEVPAAAADRPEQVAVLVGVRTHLRAVGQHQLCLEQVVDREAVLPRQVPVAAAEGQAADAGRRQDPARQGEPVLVGRGVDLAPRAAAADAHGLRVRVDGDLLQQSEIADDAVVDRSEAWPVVSAAANGDGQAVRSGEGDHLRDAVRIGRTGDQRRTFVDHPVVDGALLVVPLLVREEKLPSEAGREFLSRRRRLRGRSAHQLLPPFCHSDCVTQDAAASQMLPIYGRSRSGW